VGREAVATALARLPPPRCLPPLVFRALSTPRTSKPSTCRTAARAPGRGPRVSSSSTTKPLSGSRPLSQRTLPRAAWGRLIRAGEYRKSPQFQIACPLRATCLPQTRGSDRAPGEDSLRFDGVFSAWRPMNEGPSPTRWHVVAANHIEKPRACPWRPASMSSQPHLDGAFSSAPPTGASARSSRHRPARRCR
jgi:hypothetical protein